MTCRNADYGAFRLEKRSTVALTCSWGFPFSCVLHPFGRPARLRVLQSRALRYCDVFATGLVLSVLSSSPQHLGSALASEPQTVSVNLGHPVATIVASSEDSGIHEEIRFLN